MAPRELRKDVIGVLVPERGGPRVARQVERVLSVEDDGACLVADDDAICLRGLGQHSVDRWQIQARNVQGRIEAEAGAFRDGRYTRGEIAAVCPLRGPRPDGGCRFHEADRERVVDVAALQIGRGDQAA